MSTCTPESVLIKLLDIHDVVTPLISQYGKPLFLDDLQYNIFLSLMKLNTAMNLFPALNWFHDGFILLLSTKENGPQHKKSNNMHRRKQRRRSAVQ